MGKGTWKGTGGEEGANQQLGEAISGHCQEPGCGGDKKGNAS